MTQSENVLRRAPLLVVSALLGACANDSTDPRQGGLAGGIAGISTGAYDQRIADRQTTVRGLSSAEATLSGRLNANRDRIAELDRQLSERQRALQKMYTDVSGLESRIALVKASVTTEKGRQFSVLSQIDAATAELAKLKVALIEQEKRNAAQAAIRKQLETEAKLREDEKKAIPADRRSLIEEIERRALDADKAQKDLERRKEDVERRVAGLSV